MHILYGFMQYPLSKAVLCMLGILQGNKVNQRQMLVNAPAAKDDGR